tara:strand:+ start:1788 stop:2393 length:606 start_codon:yes stop_codon:yes gene_type:complete
MSLALCFVALSIFYVQFGYSSISLLSAASFISASVASLLFATALSLGSINYFIGWPNLRHGYQKQIGIMGFWWAVIYTITLPILYPETYWYGLSDNIFTADVILGSIALIVFGAMVLINSRLVAPYFQLQTIFFVLGLGFIAYALLVVRAILLEFNVWLLWLNTFNGFPPGKFTLSLIAITVLLLRVAVAIDKHRKLSHAS